MPEMLFAFIKDAVPGNHRKFEMTVPHGSKRQLLVHCPACLLHYKDESKFHRNAHCDVSMRIHMQTAKNIVNDPVHAWIYILLQFPPELVLDNAVLSQDQQNVKWNQVGVKYVESETGLKGIVTNSLMVYWEIAQKAPGVWVGEGSDDDKVDDSAAFD